MPIGYVANEKNEAVCLNCGAKVGTNGKAQINFCAKCGNPINIQSAIQQEKQISIEKVALLQELLDEINSGKDAKRTIQQFIAELSE